MSDEPEAIEPAAPWIMPEPVFRSTEGVTPKTARRHLNPVPDDEVDLHDTLINEESSIGPDVAPVGKAAVRGQATAASRGWARGVVFLAGLVGLIAAAMVAAAYFYYFDLRPWR